MAVTHHLKRMQRSRFIKNVALVATGTAGAHAVTMLTAPIITRLYGPEAFGVLGAFVSIVSIIVPIAAFSYPLAIVPAENDYEARQLSHLAVYISSAFACFLLLLILFARDVIVDVLGIVDLRDLLVLVPLVIVFSAWLQIAQQWNIRKNRFRLTAKVAVLTSLVLNVAKVLGGLLYPVAAVLVILTTISSAVQTSLLFLGSRFYSNQRKSKEKVSGPRLNTTAKRYYGFPLYRAPQELINAMSQSLPVLMLAGLFGPVPAGLYSLGRMVMEIPARFIGNSVRDVFYPRITEGARKGEDLSLLILKATAGMATMGIIPFGLIIAFGPSIFGIIFGNEWVGAGQYASWLAIFFFFSFINKPSIAAVPALGLHKMLLIYEVLSTAGKILGLAIGFHVFGNDLTAVALFSIVGTCSYIILILYIYSKARKGSGDNGEASTKKSLLI